MICDENLAAISVNHTTAKQACVLLCIKHNLPLTQLRRDYKSYCKSRKKFFLKQRAEDMVGLIDSRSADIYKVMKAQKRVDTTPI